MALLKNLLFRHSKMDTTRMISTGGLSMIFSGIYLSVRRHRDIPKRHAADRLMEAFKDEIQDLNQGKGDACAILKQAFPKHEQAYLQFRRYLSPSDRRNFDEAWREYSGRCQEKTQTILTEIFPEDSKSVAHVRRQLALEEILEFLSWVRKYSHLPPALRILNAGPPLQTKSPAREPAGTAPVISGWTEVINHPKEDGD
jgi:hypothetical protein